LPRPNKRIVSDGNYILQQKYLDFNSVVIPHFHALKSYALKITNHPEESEDLVQETMLKAFKFFDSFEKGTNIKGWLYRIMFNTFINDYRKKRKEPVKVGYENVQNFYDFIKTEDVKTRQLENDAFNNVLSDEIISALSLLPDDFRTIVFLSDIEGYNYQEIADFMGCLIGTVRSRLHRARKMLYTLLYRYAQESGFINSNTKYNNKYSLESNYHS
jgi:RNA polymerase sigma-70 factor, ECF subfamily